MTPRVVRERDNVGRLNSTSRNFMEASIRLAQSLCSLGCYQRATRVYPEPHVARSSFVLVSLNSFGGNLPNLPLTEFDPPNSHVSPFSSINLSVFL